MSRLRGQNRWFRISDPTRNRFWKLKICQKGLGNAIHRYATANHLTNHVTKAIPFLVSFSTSIWSESRTCLTRCRTEHTVFVVPLLGGIEATKPQVSVKTGTTNGAIT